MTIFRIYYYTNVSVLDTMIKKDKNEKKKKEVKNKRTIT